MKLSSSPAIDDCGQIEDEAQEKLLALEIEPLLEFKMDKKPSSALQSISSASLEEMKAALAAPVTEPKTQHLTDSTNQMSALNISQEVILSESCPEVKPSATQSRSRQDLVNPLG